MPNPSARRRVTTLPPRALCRVEAASYVGIGTTTFDKAVVDKIMPQPFHLYGRVLWDVRKLDAAIDALDKDETEADAWGRMQA